MELSKIIESLEHTKINFPNIYKESMKVSVPFFLLHKRIYQEGSETLNKKYDINQTQLDILSSLYIIGGKTYTLKPSQLYDRLLFSSGGMTKILKNLEKKELIKRVENKEDKRSTLVQLSPKGLELVKEALDEILCLEDKLYSKLNIKEQKTLEELLHKLLA